MAHTLGTLSPELIYLDQLHWINLSKARLGQEGTGAYADLLTELRLAVSSGRVVVPISFTHYFEVSEIARADRRANLALTMGELSKHVALTSRDDFLRYEFRRSLAKELGSAYTAPQPATTGYGAGHAFGLGGGKGRFRGDPEALDQFAEMADDFIPRLEQHTGYGWKFVPSGAATTPLELINEAADAHVQFRLLMGPTDKQDPELLKLGFNPAAAYEVVENIKRREAELANQLAAEPQWKPRLDDIIEGRALYWDLDEDWYPAVTDVWSRAVTIDEFGKERLRRIIRGIPIVDIESAIRHANFATGDHQWTTNDIHDLGFAGSAVTYCDVVLTERHLQTQLVRQRIDRKYGTAIFRSPQELTAYLRKGQTPVDVGKREDASPVSDSEAG